MGKRKHISTCKRPIRRGIHFGFFVFVLIIGFVVGYLSFRGYRDSIRHDYRDHLTGVIEFLAENMDTDNIKKCINSRTTSAKYRELQVMLNMMTDTMEDVMYINIIVPKNETEVNSALYVMDSESGQDITVSGEGSAFCILSGYDIPIPVAVDNMKAYNSKGVSYYIKNLVEGRHFTASMPLYDSKGEKFALISAAADYDYLYNMAVRYAAISMILVALISIVAIMLFMRWISRNITIPIRKLEESALEFANKCDGQKSIDTMAFNIPDITTGNEIESLMNSIKHMASSMRGYVQEILNEEQKTEAMTAIAYKDALTHVKSKAAYDIERARLIEDIAQNQAQFGILMVDVNNLKHINDTYGHECGDEYIIGSCRLICDIYAHSSVYRIGGDEFVVVLLGRDYDVRNDLIRSMRLRFKKAASDSEEKPWHRYSAASGMAVYSDGDSFDDVFRRADNAMYDNKSAIKKRNDYEI